MPEAKVHFRTHRVRVHDLDPAELVQHMAVHESGHAVVGLALGLGVVEIDIKSDAVAHIDGGLILGGTRFEAPDDDMNELARQRPAEMGMALFAGMCAEEVILGSHLGEAWAGDFRILRIGHGWIEGRSELPPEVITYANDAYEAVGHQETEIRTVANALLQAGRLTGEEIGVVLETLDGGR